MGGLGSGRHADQIRRAEALRLRAEGLTAGDIGRRLGVSRQRVQHVLRLIARERCRSLACRTCGGVAAPPGAAPADARNVLCLACLGRWPGAPFAERLRSCRVAAGLRRDELARRAGLTPETVRFYEAGRQRPHARSLLALAGVLGPALVSPAEGSEAGRTTGPRPVRVARGATLLWPRPPLTVAQVLAWADAYRRRTGRWPHADSGPVADAPGETWQAISRALVRGSRGLPGGSSLALLLEEHRGKRNKGRTPPLTTGQILLWADAHFRRTGRWPCATSGPVLDAPGESWRAVVSALYAGHRGLPGGDTLARLLGRERGQPSENAGPPKLTGACCADRHSRLTFQAAGEEAAVRNALAGAV